MYIYRSLICYDVLFSASNMMNTNIFWHLGTCDNKQARDYQMLLSLHEPQELFIASSHQMVLASGCWHQGTPNSNW